MKVAVGFHDSRTRLSLEWRRATVLCSTQTQTNDSTCAQLLLKILETQDLTVDHAKVAAAWRMSNLGTNPLASVP